MVSAVYVWGIARALGGRVLLRIEDHDRTRSRPEYEAALLEDLEWLGLIPDLGTPGELRRGPCPCRQSDRESIYREALDHLRRTATVYACECSRKDIAEHAGDRVNEERRYPGTCRARGLAEEQGRGIRAAMEPGIERFDDGRLGPQAQEPARQCGDLLLRDRLGQWTYQFAVTVDDREQGIDLVIRGEDLLDSTGRQIRLARLLGREAPPVYLHHPLVVKPSGEKLSKSNRDTGVRDLRAAGVGPGLVLGRAAALAGLVPEARAVSAGDLAGLFD